MPLWGKAAANTAAPKFKLNTRTANIRGTTAYANTTVGAITKGLAVGVVSANAAQAAADHTIAHVGWIKVSRHTGPVTTLNITVAGSGYSNTDTVRVSGGTTNATATIVTNGSGAITSVTLTNKGAGFVNTAVATVALLASGGGASAGTGATVTVTLGGRAGRIQKETLVAGRQIG